MVSFWPASSSAATSVSASSWTWPWSRPGPADVYADEEVTLTSLLILAALVFSVSGMTYRRVTVRPSCLLLILSISSGSSSPTRTTRPKWS